MRGAYLIRLPLILGWQAAIVAALFYFDKPPNWVSDALVASALVFPFVGYIVIFYASPKFVTPSHIARLICITLASIAATIVGFAFFLPLMFFLFMAFGGHHW